jgi:Protein of unknown function (DUF3455)
MSAAGPLPRRSLPLGGTGRRPSGAQINAYLVLSAAAVLAACASAPPAAPVPDNLKPGVQERAAFTRHARGVQIYRCDAAEGAAFKWTFVAPEAQLYDSAASQAVVGTHGAGPFWQGTDGSRVVGKVKSRADASNAAADIPWLLLTTSAEGPSGPMSAVKSVQRINTRGGVAPASGCTAAGDVGKQARVPYVADYVFFIGV